MADKKEGLMFEYFVPIQSSAELDGDFTINGIAINETTTSNGHKFIGEELSKAASSMIGVPLLKDHENSIDSIVGKVNAAHWDEALRNIPFKAIVKDAKVKQLIKDGLLSTVSVGAHVRPEDIEEGENGDIIPHNIQFKELSVVAVPADGGATFSMALNNVYKSYSTKDSVEDSMSNERRNKMTEEEEKTETVEAPVEAEVETPAEAEEEKPEEVSDEEKAVDEKIKALRIKAKKKQLKALQDADGDEVKAEVPEEKEEAKAEDTEEETEEEAEEVAEKGDYKFNQGHKFFGIQRKSYTY